MRVDEEQIRVNEMFINNTKTVTVHDFYIMYCVINVRRDVRPHPLTVISC